MTQADLAALVPGWLHTASVVAALMTIPSVILDVVVGLPAWLAACAHWLNWAVWSVFLLTLLVVIVRAPSPWAALRADPVLALIVVCTTPVLPAGLQIEPSRVSRRLG